MTYGLGMFVGAQIAGALFNGFLGGADALTLERWHDFWLAPAGFALLVLTLFLLSFKDEAKDDAERPQSP